MFVDNHCHLLMEHSRLAEQLADRLMPGLYCLMSTSFFDLETVHELMLKSDKVVPYYGVHPWYSHLYRVGTESKEEHYNKVLQPSPPLELLETLPDPVDFSEYLAKMREYAGACKERKRMFGIGELGLDKLFRVPTNGFYGNPAIKENVRLTNCKVTMDHQLHVYTEQLRLANELHVPVSLHCVKAHGAFFDSLAKSSAYNDIPAIVLHSYTGSIEQARSWVKEYRKKPTRLLFSFSNYINATEQKIPTLHDVLDILDSLQILLETDMPLDRFFLLDKNQEYSEHVEGITAAVCSRMHWNQKEAEGLLYKNSMEIYSV